jgi:hypothetical protein
MTLKFWLKFGKIRRIYARIFLKTQKNSIYISENGIFLPEKKHWFENQTVPKKTSSCFVNFSQLPTHINQIQV